MAIKESTMLPVAVMLPTNVKEKEFCSVAAACASSIGADSIGLALSGPITSISDDLRWYRQFTSKPLMLFLNGCDGCGPTFSGLEAAQLKQLNEIKEEFGVVAFGGGDKTGPDHIYQLCRYLQAYVYYKKPFDGIGCITSSNRVLTLNEFRIIGVLALDEGDGSPLDKLLRAACRQEEEGVDAVFLSSKNVGIETEEDMERVIRALQKKTELPVIISAEDIRLMEAALWAYSGKPGLFIQGIDLKDIQQRMEIALRFGCTVFWGRDLPGYGPKKIDFKEIFYTAAMINDQWRIRMQKWPCNLVQGMVIPREFDGETLSDALNFLKRVHLKLNCISFCDCVTLCDNEMDMSGRLVSFVTQVLDRECHLFFTATGVSELRQAAKIYFEMHPELKNN